VQESVLEQAEEEVINPLKPNHMKTKALKVFKDGYPVRFNQQLQSRFGGVFYFRSLTRNGGINVTSDPEDRSFRHTFRAETLGLCVI